MVQIKHLQLFGLRTETAKSHTPQQSTRRRIRFADKDTSPLRSAGHPLSILCLRLCNLSSATKIAVGDSQNMIKGVVEWMMLCLPKTAYLFNNLFCFPLLLLALHEFHLQEA